MKILHEGDPSLITQSVMFRCYFCGCVFVADENEFRHEQGRYIENEYSAICPCCMKRTYTSEGMKGV